MTKKESKEDGPKEQTLCDWSKEELEKYFEQLCEIVSNPRFICIKCGGRTAGQKKWLCKPKKMSRGLN